MNSLQCSAHNNHLSDKQDWFKEDHNPTWLKLALDCQNSIFNQVANGVSVLAVKKITEKANALDIE
ncbi:MAG: hypothetical protein M3044_16035 [Thermoproteota archaeon]|jgi:hypothetical protein|nr:hypothetical protein [Thermoproteota archaeon]